MDCQAEKVGSYASHCYRIVAEMRQKIDTLCSDCAGSRVSGSHSHLHYPYLFPEVTGRMSVDSRRYRQYPTIYEVVVC